MSFVEFLKIVVFGVIEGITEWLPISSTGHLMLAEEFLRPDVSEHFFNVFLVVIQLGAILAVVLLFWNNIWPFTKDPEQSHVKIQVLALWIKILCACLPAAVIGLLLDDWLDSVFYTGNRGPITVGLTLIIYGILFIVVENKRKDVKPAYNKLATLPLRIAFYIGLFQLLALIPGTSRSGATILGAMLIGTNRAVAAEFTFYLAIPVMAGASLLKIVKYLHEYGSFSGNEIVMLAVGSIVAFIVSFYVIRFFLGYIRNHDFKPFGYYRIVAGTIILAYFIFI